MATFPVNFEASVNIVEGLEKCFVTWYLVLRCGLPLLSKERFSITGVSFLKWIRMSKSPANATSLFCGSRFLVGLVKFHSKCEERHPLPRTRGERSPNCCFLPPCCPPPLSSDTVLFLGFTP